MMLNGLLFFLIVVLAALAIVLEICGAVNSDKTMLKMAAMFAVTTIVFIGVSFIVR